MRVRIMLAAMALGLTLGGVAALPRFEAVLEAATCTGSAPCRACKNCSSCKHCAKEGGTCGVCKKN